MYCKMQCLICNKKLSIIEQQITCSYCSRNYCMRHRLPDIHNCSDLQSKSRQRKIPKNKPKFVDFPRTILD